MGRSKKALLFWEHATLMHTEVKGNSRLFTGDAIVFWLHVGTEPGSDPLLAVCDLWTPLCQSWLFIGQGMVGRFLCNYRWAQHEAACVFPCSQPADVVQLYSREQCCNGLFSVSQSWHLTSPWWFSGFCKVSLSLENIVLEVEKNTSVKKLPGKISFYSFLLLSPDPNLLSRFSC